MNGGLGIAPLLGVPLWAWIGGGGLAVGAASGWFGRGKADDAVEVADLYANPPRSAKINLMVPPAPAAPQTEYELRNWTPQMMFDRVADDWEKFRIAQTAAVEFGDPITLPQGDNTLLWIGGGLAVVGLALALR